MQENSKYFKAEKIMARLQRRFPKRMLSVNIGDVVEICAEIEFEVLNSYTGMVHKNKVGVKANSNRLMLPCDIFRLKDVYTSDGTRIMGFTNNGTYLHFNEQCNIRPVDNTEVYINYDGIPVDESGWPLFLRGHEQACEWGCIIRLMEEDHADGSINENVWQGWLQQYENALNTANNGFRHKDRNEMKEFMLCIYDMIPKVKEMHLYNLG